MKYILLLVLFTSCVTTQKAIKKLDSSPIESSNYCSTRFPTIDSIVTKDSIHFDTLYIPDSIIYSPYEVVSEWGSTATDTVLKYKIVTKYIIKTIIHDSTIYRDNPNTQARIKHLEQITAVKDSDITRISNGRHIWRIEGLIASGLFLLLLIFIVYANVKKL